MNREEQRANSASAIVDAIKSLKLRMPIGTERLIAAMAARGVEGTVQGVDYRNKPVFATIRKVPDTGWAVIAEIDEAEIYGPIYKEEVTVTAIVIFMIAAFALGVTTMWKGGKPNFSSTARRSFPGPTGNSRSRLRSALRIF